VGMGRVDFWQGRFSEAPAAKMTGWWVQAGANGLFWYGNFLRDIVQQARKPNTECRYIYTCVPKDCWMRSKISDGVKCRIRWSR